MTEHAHDIKRNAKPAVDPQTILRAAKDYRKRGWRIIDVDQATKGSREKGWTTLVLDEKAVEERFGKVARNIAVVLGEASNGLIDIDLDTPEARTLAPEFLPSTACFGRPSSPKSHYLYVVDGDMPSQGFEDIGKEMLLEIRSDRRQTNFPPSIHPSGEAINWVGDIEPSSISVTDLQPSVKRLAIATLLARHWPKIHGSRQEVAVALAGCLTRSGFSDAEAGKLIKAIARAAGDEEANKRGATSKNASQRLERDEPTYGWPKLVELFGADVVDKVRGWLGLETPVFAKPTTRTSFTAEELMRVKIPPQTWIVPNILPTGLTILAGRPKVGKSWLGLHLALEKALGGEFLGSIELGQSEVLYLALEDGDRRLQYRLSIVLKGRRAPPNLRFRTKLQPLDKGGFEDIEAELKMEPKPELVIVDTFGRISPTPKRNGNAYLEDYGNFSKLHELALDNDVALVLVHHTRKPTHIGADDVLNEVSGTSGITGAADTIFVLNKASNGEGLELHLTGRDIDEQVLRIIPNIDAGTWTLDGYAEAVGLRPERKAIQKVLEEAAKPLRPSEVTSRLTNGSNEPAVRKLLSKMLKDGQLYQPKSGYYTNHTGHNSHDQTGPISLDDCIFSDMH